MSVTVPIDGDDIDAVSSRQPSQFGGWMDVVDGSDLSPLPPEREVTLHE